MIGPEHRVPVDVLYQAWRAWADVQGHTRISNNATFGRDLRAAVPTLHRGRPRLEGERRPHYDGIALRKQWQVQEDNPGQEEG